MGFDKLFWAFSIGFREKLNFKLKKKTVKAAGNKLKELQWANTRTRHVAKYCYLLFLNTYF